MFGEFLVSNGSITKKQLDEALAIQKYKKEKLGRLLVELNILCKKQLNSSLISYLKPQCPLSVSKVLNKRKEVLPEDSSFENYYLIEVSSKQVILVGQYFSDEIIKKAELHYNKQIKLWIIDEEVFHLIDTDNKGNHSFKSSINITKSLSDEQRLEENNPYGKLIQESIDQAIEKGASDIHYEPFEDIYIIRFRIHGELKDWKTINQKHSEAITTKLKYILNMNMAVVGKPQDSRASLPRRKLDIRASSFPVITGGEKIVLRLQKQDQEFVLEELGLSNESYTKILDSAQKRDGLILISGPTGSGKTTTLYSLLCKMDKYGKNVSTLENPVEKKLDRINQGNISDYQSFEDFQRALMRQDPDIILVGEVRDKESASLCMKLSSTGHLVLSTLHANGAKEVVERLKNLGVDEFSIISNLRLSIAQRLLRKICDHCKIDAPVSLIKKVLKNNEYLPVSNFSIINPKGCEKCQNGIVDRIAIIEYLDKKDIQNYLDDPGRFRPNNSLKQESLRLAAKGHIDLNEVLQFS